MKRIDLDDPRLTAYALGELDVNERAAIEALLEAHPECRAVVDEIRQTAALLSAQLAQEPCPSMGSVAPEVVLSDAKVNCSLGKRRVEDNAPYRATPKKIIAFPRVLAMAAGMAASIVAIVLWQSSSNPRGRTERPSLSGPENKRSESISALVATQVIQPTLHRTNVTPTLAANAVPITNKISAASLTFQDAPLSQVLDLYENLSGRTVLRGNYLPETRLNIRSESDVTRGEAVGALETILAMNRVTMIPQGAKFAKAVSQNSVPMEGSRFNEYSIALDPGAAQQNQSHSYTIAPNDSKDRVQVGTMAPLTGVSVYRTDNLSVAKNDWSGPASSSEIYGLVPTVPAKRETENRPLEEKQNWAFLEQNYAPLRTDPPRALDRESGELIYVDKNRSGSIDGDSRVVPGQSPSVYSQNSVGVAEHSAQRLATARFSPDGKRIITTSADEQVRLWDAKTRKELPEVRQEIMAYAPFVENRFEFVVQQPLSTFSIDVDTASYANVRRFLNQNRLPPRDAIRIEEMINYFSYNYPPPQGDDPFAASVEVAGCPWNAEHRLVRVALKGREMRQEKRPPSNFVFLIDVSGSMQPAERLPLIKQGLRMLVKKMNEHDRVAIVVYASTSGLRLPSTSCAEKEKILAAIDALEAGGSTNGGEGIQQAYATAKENFIKGGINRVILCTDGDFNVGITDQNELVRLIQEQARSGIFLSALGVGTDNYKDALMQKLADKGNGNYHYIDTLEEAQKVLIEQMNGTLVTIAKDVKIQIEFNPAQVSVYRLIGYEKRMLRKEDFNNDRKDAGEIGAGHTVTAFYEIMPAGRGGVRPAVDALKYQPAIAPASYSANEFSHELLTLKLRYKQPDGNNSKLVEFPAADSGASYGKASVDFKFATAVAAFGMILRDSEYKGSANFDGIVELAEEGKGADAGGYRAEFINLVKKAKTLK